MAGGNGEEADGPRAFVNILVFDKNHNFVDLAYEAISESALENGSDVPHDQMYAEYIVREAGYVYMFVSNENPTQVDVYFDDIVMTHSPGNIIQYNEYYPFGMRTAASWDRVEEKTMPSMTTSLAAKLTFDGNTNDTSGNGNHATASGGPVLTGTQGRPNTILLDGTDDYLQIADHASLDFGANNFSIAIWVKKLAATSSHDNREVIHKWNNMQPVGSNEWLLATTSDGTDSKVRFHVSQGSTYTTLTTPDEISIGRWYHLSVIRAGSILNLYVNGVLKASANIGTAAINNVGNNVMIGKAYNGLQTNAAYDDLYIYNRALTEEELRYLYLDRPDLMVNSYLYNGGSEFNDQTGGYEMFFRGYDPVLGRMNGVDVMADSYSSLTPYQYANNDPVYFNDPTGAYAQYERASRGGCGCWRDNGPQDYGGEARGATYSSGRTVTASDIAAIAYNPDGGTWSASSGLQLFSSFHAALMSGLDYNFAMNSTAYLSGDFVFRGDGSYDYYYELSNTSGNYNYNGNQVIGSVAYDYVSGRVPDQQTQGGAQPNILDQILSWLPGERSNGTEFLVSAGSNIQLGIKGVARVVFNPMSQVVHRSEYTNRGNTIYNESLGDKKMWLHQEFGFQWGIGVNYKNVFSSDEYGTLNGNYPDDNSEISISGFGLAVKFMWGTGGTAVFYGGNLGAGVGIGVGGSAETWYGNVIKIN